MNRLWRLEWATWPENMIKFHLPFAMSLIWLMTSLELSSLSSPAQDLIAARAFLRAFNACSWDLIAYRRILITSASLLTLLPFFLYRPIPRDIDSESEWFEAVEDTPLDESPGEYPGVEELNFLLMHHCSHTVQLYLRHHNAFPPSYEWLLGKVYTFSLS